MPTVHSVSQPELILKIRTVLHQMITAVASAMACVIIAFASAMASSTVLSVRVDRSSEPVRTPAG